MGLLGAAIVHAAAIQDRDGAVPLLASVRSAFPGLWYILGTPCFAHPDGSYVGGKLKGALSRLGRWRS
jgi:putative transposase